MNDILKIMTCGSVDDGKSTLIGHMLYNAKLLFTDQEKSLELESRTRGMDGELDYSLLLDGLIAEREQGITIDVAYRYFSTNARSFIVADTPGHEEYTRNMAVGASFADLAILLVDAGKGILTQTRRHLRVCSLMGIRNFVFAVNKMDSVAYSRDVFASIEADIGALMTNYSFDTLRVIPLSALKGDNITEYSQNMPWYKGEALLPYLENVNVSEYQEEGFILPIQRVSRPDSSYRGFQGQISSGDINVGDEVTILPAKLTSRIKTIVSSGEYSESAGRGMSVSVELTDEIDISRGSVLVKDTELSSTYMVEARILWMDEVPLIEGKSYWIKIGSQLKTVTVMKIKYGEDINNGSRIAVSSVNKNDFACIVLACNERIICDTFRKHREMGRFILIDKISNQTSACGTIDHSMRRSDNLTWHDFDVTREIRANSLGQMPVTLWFTGLSGSGKSVLANGIEKLLATRGMHTMLLDGDNVRMGINKDLGFEEKDRIENIRRVAETAKLMNDAGLIVLTSFISPYQADRERARSIIGPESFVEIYVSTPIEECEKRDVKGLYGKARRGEIPNFTGVGSPYEPPQDPDIVIDTTGMSGDEASFKLIKELEKYLKKQ